MNSYEVCMVTTSVDPLDTTVRSAHPVNHNQNGYNLYKKLLPAVRIFNLGVEPEVFKKFVEDLKNGVNQG